MRVLIISSNLPSVKYPLNGIFAFDQAKALQNNGVDVTFFSIDLRSIFRKRPYGITHEVKDGIDCHSISFPVGNVPYELFCYIGGIALRILYHKVFKKGCKPDVIHAHFTDMGKIASVLSEHINVPYVVTEHSSYLNQRYIPKSLKKLAFSAYEKSSQTIAVSSQLASSIKRITGFEAIVVPNVIDIEIFSNSLPEKHNCFNFVTTANLIERKRVLNVIKAIENLLPRYPNICLNVVGDGYLRESLQEYVKKNNLENSVFFYGRLSREDTAKIYSKSDCFVLVSEVETFGVVYVEAMASGLPVIASRCGGPEDFVTKENGILVDVDNSNQLEKAMVEIQHLKFDREKIKTKVMENYGPLSLSKRLKIIYEKVINQ